MIEYVLGEIADVKTGPFGTQLKASEYVSDGIPIINVKNIGFGNLIKDDMDYVDLSTCKRLEEHILKENDIVFGRKGSVDRHCIIRSEEEGWLQGSDCIRVRIHNAEVNPQYVSCYLMQEGVKRQLNNAAVGSTMASMNSNIIKSITMKLPSIEEQNIIADFFEKIHQKIENNNRINQELERMAKSIYDYWFLQFEFPDEEGNPYKSSGGKMVWNEVLKREIPEGWESKKLGDIFEFIKGKTPDKLFQVDKKEYTSYLTIEAINGNGLQYCKKDSMIMTNGEVLMVMDGAASSEVYVGNTGAIGSTFCKLQVIENYLENNFLYLVMKSLENIFKKVNTGSTVPHANKKYICNFNIAMPIDKIIRERMQGDLNLFLEQILEHKKENHELVSLRNFLLPLLMNGQVEFKL